MVTVLVVVACGPAAPGTLTLRASPTSIVGAARSTITVDAREPGDLIGAGTITFSVAKGELEATSVSLDSFGSAQTRFSCPRCGTESVTVTASWVSKGGTVTETIRVSVMGDGGATGGGSAAGGSAAGGSAAGGSAAGGSAAGGSAAGGSAAGGSSGGGSSGGGSSGGGSSGGGSSGGGSSGGGSSGGGSSGGGFIPVGGGCVATLSGPTSGDVPCAFTAAIAPPDAGTNPFTMQLLRGNGGPLSLNIAMNALPIDVAVRTYQWPDISARGAELRVDEQLSPGVLRSWSANVYRARPPPSFNLALTSLTFEGIDPFPRDAGYSRYSGHGTLDAVLPYEGGPADAGMANLTVHIVF